METNKSYWLKQKEYALNYLENAERHLAQLATREFVYPTVTEITSPKHRMTRDSFVDDLRPLGQLVLLRPDIDDLVA